MRDIARAGPDREAALLYDEAVTALSQAITAITEDDIEARCAAVRAATESITTLYLNLDVRRWGESIEGLAETYDRILAHLIGVNFYNDSAIARQALELLEPLRDPWAISGGMVSAWRSIATQAPTANGARTCGTTAAARRPAAARSPS